MAKMTQLDDRVAAMRAFNRFYTRRIGVLGAGLLGTEHPLPQARVLYELGRRETTQVSDLRRELDMDAGHLSRVLAGLESDGLLERERSPTDGRRQLVRLTAAGRRAHADLDARSAAEFRAVLAELPDAAQRRALAAMRELEAVLGDAARPQAVLLREPRAGELGWIVQRHGALYAEEYGWDESFEALVAQIVAAYAAGHDPRRERTWIAEVAGAPAGCVMCVADTATAAKLRLLLVEPSARGLGIGARLVDECIAFARRAGYRELALWTNDVLHAARRIYEHAGFELRSEERHRSFGHDLIGQDWWLRL
jgi:DNA-binding MarR family transcriptional regulator/GNAT superfamily N-acetyltransferase